tara:strand:+ start:3479 stop:5344 length:1866 start_codon:yes stop_codon:yes gene_type:complete
MAINTQKLLNTKVSTVSGKSIGASQGTTQDLSFIREGLININRVFRRKLRFQKEQSEDARKDAEKKEFKRREKFLEGARKIAGARKGMLGRLIPAKARSYWETIKNYFLTIFLGFIALRLVSIVPQLKKLITFLAGAADFVINWGGKILNGLVSFIGWTDKLYGGFRDVFGGIFGAKGLGALDTVTNAIVDILNILGVVGSMSLYLAARLGSLTGLGGKSVSGSTRGGGGGGDSVLKSRAREIRARTKQKDLLRRTRMQILERKRLSSRFFERRTIKKSFSNVRQPVLSAGESAGAVRIGTLDKNEYKKILKDLTEKKGGRVTKDIQLIQEHQQGQIFDNQNKIKKKFVKGSGKFKVPDIRQTRFIDSAQTKGKPSVKAFQLIEKIQRLQIQQGKTPSQFPKNLKHKIRNQVKLKIKKPPAPKLKPGKFRVVKGGNAIVTIVGTIMVNLGLGALFNQINTRIVSPFWEKNKLIGSDAWFMGQYMKWPLSRIKAQKKELKRFVRLKEEWDKTGLSRTLRVLGFVPGLLGLDFNTFAAPYRSDKNYQENLRHISLLEVAETQAGNNQSINKSASYDSKSSNNIIINNSGGNNQSADVDNNQRNVPIFVTGGSSSSDADILYKK